MTVYGYRGGGGGVNDRRNQLVAAMSNPHREAANRARASAVSASAGAGQASGNAFLAQRSANRAGTLAAQPHEAAAAGAVASAQVQHLRDEEERRRYEQTRADRFLGGALSAAGGGLSVLTNAFGGMGGGGAQAGGGGGGMGGMLGPLGGLMGGGGQPGPAAGAPQPTSPMAPNPMASPELKQAEAALAMQPGAMAAQMPQPAAQAPTMAMPAAQPVAAAPQQAPMGMSMGGAQQPPQNPMGGLGALAGQAAPFASMIPGWGTLAGLGLGAFSGMTR